MIYIVDWSAQTYKDLQIFEIRLSEKILNVQHPVLLYLKYFSICLLGKHMREKVDNYQMGRPPPSWKYRIYYPGIISLHLPSHTYYLKGKKKGGEENTFLILFLVAFILLVQLISVCSKAENKVKEWPISMEIYIRKCACFGYQWYEFILYSEEYKTMKKGFPLHTLSSAGITTYYYLFQGGKMLVFFSLSQRISFNWEL